ncbi:hypothetical protein N865_16525 [Intrasporangium oryzae NRRL B-24470]|uniref:DUF4333 domain-containing protein n=1 Tax=Intrasporangium oryzae NRRL B-24470 TaxID=1386089 RepID=W9G2E8_9MICO|nr:DUF4333 domain-containing protein [Intrasporangium oryzae]EWT00296.1 hypothetical protein N865_16525 [Intrasporangium oryzae NRRL B-24470]
MNETVNETVQEPLTSPTQTAPATPAGGPTPWSAAAIPAQPAGWTQPWTPPAPYVPAPRAGSGNGLAIAALVMSIIALVCVVGMGALAVLAGGGPGSTTPMTGTLPSGSTVTPLSGADLSRTVSARIAQDGSTVDEMQCPATPKVAQGVVTVCHGTVDGGDWAVVVYFEDAIGSYTLALV